MRHNETPREPPPGLSGARAWLTRDVASGKKQLQGSIDDFALRFQTRELSRLADQAFVNVCEDHTGLLFRLANGGTAICHLDFLRPASAPTDGDDRLRIAGSEGVLEGKEIDNRVNLISAKSMVGELPLPPPVDFFGTFIASLRGEGELLVSTKDAFAITRICLRARDAADAGTWVRL